ncbi:MAG: ABC transporter permease subunit [Euryarchaeota archaeon]|nr:ABC transporter permease subunit [Euryarchaeota archaeon]
MTGETRLLAADSLLRWMRAPGFLMVLAVALIPPAMTAAWVGTHDEDIAVTGLSWDPQNPELGDLINFTVDVKNLMARDVGPFNVTLRIGYTDESFGRSAFIDSFNSTKAVDGLGPNEATTVAYSWNTSGNLQGNQLIRTIGTLLVEAIVDPDDKIAEVEDQNNRRHAQFSVSTPPPPPAEAPEDPEREDGGNNTTRTFLNARIDGIRIDPPADHDGDPDDYVPFAGDQVNITVQVRNLGPDTMTNASVDILLTRFTYEATTVEGRTTVQPVQAPGAPPLQASRDLEPLGANESRDVTFNVPRELQVSPYQAIACLHSGEAVGYQLPQPWSSACGFVLGAAEGDDPNDNIDQSIFRADRHVPYEPPEPQATAKDFYRNKVLLPIHFTLLVPFIALFYAGGVLSDDRNRGNLPYLLTRPVPRWQIPLSRFGASFAVALVAVLVGVIITYLLLLGTPRAGAAYFWWPLGFSVLVLLAYSGLFTLIGVWSDRPYLVGLLYILGFETLLAIGQSVLVNGRPLVQDWFITWFSLNHWVRRAMETWDPNAATAIFNASDLTPILVLVGVAVVGLVGAAVMMQNREFHE